MVCQVCGRSVEAGDRFCTGCGVSLTERAPVAAADAGDTHTPAATAGAAGTHAAAASDDAADGTAGVMARVAAVAGTDDRDASTAPEARAADPGAPTELVELVDDDGWGDIDPVWAPTAPNQRITSAAATRTADLPATEPVTEVRPPSSGTTTRSPAAGISTTDAGAADTPTGTVTAQMPATPVPAPAPEPRRRISAVAVFGLATAGLLLASLFTTALAVESDIRLTSVEGAPPAFRTGTWIVDDLADNLSVAGLFAALAIVVGAVSSVFRWRWGSGLAGGAGLATAGLAVLAVGLAQAPIDAAHDFAAIPNEQVFVLTITRDVGYWLLVAAAAIGVLTFFASLNDATGDPRPGLNPWIAALGGLATVVAVGGPLIPENLAHFTDNWYIADGPGEPSAMLLAGRLIQLGLLAVSGLVGFLSVRRWGLGVALGGALPSLWLALSTLTGITDIPVGPGWRNPGADTAELHGVTIIGFSAVLAMWVLAAIAAYDQSVRERR